MPRFDGRDPFRVIRTLVFLIRRKGPLPGEDWQAGVLEPDGLTFLAIDGLGTSSYAEHVALRDFVPWIEEARFVALASNNTANLRGLSYSGYRKHYAPNHTDITLTGRAADIFEPFAPSFTQPQRVVYIGFSLGGSVAGFGLARLVRARRQTVLQTEPNAKPSLVLVQPALALSVEYEKALESAGALGMPAVMRELLDLGDDVRQQFLDGVRDCIEAGINVALLYWPHDRMLVYPAEFRAALEQMGVPIHPLDYLPDPRGNDFAEHANVSRHDRTFAALAEILREP